jgi:hypothetical protein
MCYSSCPECFYGGESCVHLEENDFSSVYFDLMLEDIQERLFNWLPNVDEYDIVEDVDNHANNLSCVHDELADAFPIVQCRLIHKSYFRSNITKELIAVAMHPCRIQAQLNQYDDIESFFTAMGC